MPSDKSWIADTLVQFTHSPVWRTPVNNFIDDNCESFDSDEEMKFEYTSIHNQFRALVDDLLTNFVQELGVPLDEALDAVKSTMGDKKYEGHRPLKRLMEYIFMVEDFRSFHRLMAKRNIELEILAAGMLQRQGVDLTGDDPAVLQALMARAQAGDLRFSAMQANGDIDEETAFRAAVAASLAEQGPAARQLDLEEAQLQEALALSVQAAVVTAQQSAAKVEAEAKIVAQSDAAAAKKMRDTGLAAIEEQKNQTIQKLTAHTIEACAVNHEKRCEIIELEESQPLYVILPKTPVPASEPVAAPRAPAPAPGPAAAALPVPVPAVALAPIKAGGGHSAPGRAALTPLQAPGAPALPPLQGPSGLRPLANPAAAPSAPAAPRATDPAAAKGQPTKEELEARAKHMKEQRARIVAQNKAKRQQDLSEFAAKSGAPAPDGKNDVSAAQKQLTVDIARRLREDMVNEARKGS